jgi:hypothetical protein
VESASSGNKEKNMKRSILMLIFTVILSSLPAISQAEERPATGKRCLIFDTGLDVYSKYVCGTSGSVAHNKAVIQGYVKLSVEPWGLYVKSWGSGILDPDGKKRGGNEIDPFIVGIARNVWVFRIDAGYGYYDLHPQFRAKGDLHGIFGTISLPNRYVTPYLTVEADLPTVKKTLEGGFVYRAGLTKSFALRKNLALVVDLSIGGHDGAYGFRPEFVSHARGGLSLCWSPWKNVTISPQVYYQKRLGFHPGNGGLTRDAFWGGMSLNIKHELLSF